MAIRKSHPVTNLIPSYRAFVILSEVVVRKADDNAVEESLQPSDSGLLPTSARFRVIYPPSNGNSRDQFQE
jgi:hypothetical protein